MSEVVAANATAHGSTHAMEKATARRVADGEAPGFDGVLPAGLSAARQWEAKYWQKVDELMEAHRQTKNERNGKDALLFERTHTRRALRAASHESQKMAASTNHEFVLETRKFVF